MSECSHSVHLAVTDKNDNLVKGIFSVENIDCDDGVFELADVSWTPQMKRTRVYTESIYLVLSLFLINLATEEANGEQILIMKKPSNQRAGWAIE